MVTERGVTVAQAGKDLDVHENVLRKWGREMRDEPQVADATALRAEVWPPPPAPTPIR